MNYQEAVEYILRFADYEKTPLAHIVYRSFNLDRIRGLMETLGDPHLATPTVHIAGTKGKGSTSAMIASALTACGYKTGLYTSPHLHTIRERVAVDGAAICEAELTALVEKVQPYIEASNAMGKHGRLTTFEILTGLAFAYFKEKRLDFQVLETGMGGRLDATNVSSPEVCCITSISYDHTDVLGNTLTQIAGEKAGIIKPGVPVVSAPQTPEAQDVIDRVSHERDCELITVGKDVTWDKISSGPDGQSFILHGLNRDYNLDIPLLGAYQLENAAVAVAALEVLEENGTRLTDEGIAQGLRQVHWPGRLELLQREPLLVVDGAHNPYSAFKLREALSEYFYFKRVILIVGTSINKDSAGFTEELLALPLRVLATQSRHPRAGRASSIADEFRAHGVEAETMESVAAAIERAQEIAAPGDLILATGSLFVVAEAREAVLGLKPELYPSQATTPI